MWSFRRPGGNGMELASSDAMAARFALPVSGLLFPFLHRARRFFSFSKKRKKRMGAQKGRPMPLLAPAASILPQQYIEKTADAQPDARGFASYFLALLSTTSRSCAAKASSVIAPRSPSVR